MCTEQPRKLLTGAVPNLESKGCSLLFLKVMIAEWAEYSLIWSRLSHGMNHVRHVCCA